VHTLLFAFHLLYLPQSPDCPRIILYLKLCPLLNIFFITCSWSLMTLSMQKLHTNGGNRVPFQTPLLISMGVLWHADPLPSNSSVDMLLTREHAHLQPLTLTKIGDNYTRPLTTSSGLGLYLKLVAMSTKIISISLTLWSHTFTPPYIFMPWCLMNYAQEQL
jgi:hypothetical protein